MSKYYEKVKYPDLPETLRREFENSLSEEKSEARQKEPFDTAPLNNDSEGDQCSEVPSLAGIFGEQAIVDVNADYKNEIPEKDWIVKGICTSGECVIISGSSKSGKSYLMTDLAITAAMGGRWLKRFNCKECRVLYINGENSINDARKRFQLVITEKHVLPETCEQITLVCADGIMKNIGEMIETLCMEVQKHGYGLIVIDPLYCFYKGSELDEEDAKGFVAAIKEICRRTGAAVFCVHHHSKGGQSFYSNASSRASGSGMLQRAFSSLLDVSEIRNKDDEEEGEKNERYYEFTGEPRQAASFKCNLVFHYPTWDLDEGGKARKEAANKLRTEAARSANKNNQKAEKIREMLPELITQAFRENAQTDKRGSYITAGNIRELFRKLDIDVSERSIERQLDDGLCPGYRRDTTEGSRRKIRQADFEPVPEGSVEGIFE